MTNSLSKINVGKPPFEGASKLNLSGPIKLRKIDSSCAVPPISDQLPWALLNCLIFRDGRDDTRKIYEYKLRWHLKKIVEDNPDEEFAAYVIDHNKYGKTGVLSLIHREHHPSTGK